MVLLKSRLSFSLALAKLPTLHLYAAAPPDVLAQVKSILEEFYTDGIDQVLSAELDRSGNIVGEFSDRVGARQVKRYQYQITDDEVTYKLLNPNEVSSFAMVAQRTCAQRLALSEVEMSRSSRSIESFKPLFGVGARAGKKKNCAKSTPCGDSCIAVGKVCRKKPGSAVKAKIAEAKTAIGGKSKSAANPPSKSPLALKSQGFIDPIEDDFGSATASKEIFKDPEGKTFEFHTPTSANSYSTQNTMWPIAIRNGEDSAYYGLTAAGRAASLDQNQIMGLPQSAKKQLSPEDLKKETQFRQDLIAATTPDGGTVVMYGRGKSDRSIAQSLGLNPAEHFDFSDDFERDLKTSGEANKKLQNINSKDIFIGRYENGKIRAITEQEIADINTIKTLRQEQINKGTQAQSIQYTRSLFERNGISPDSVGSASEIAQGFKDEDAIVQKLKATEDRYLGRKPTQIGDYKSYETKADTWAKETFGNFGDGANGFTLAQTKAHDVAHPITHELLNSNSKEISKQLGNLKQADGKPSLLGEEAIVNVVEHLSRGDSIEASILNGLRLARVLSRSPSEGDKAREYVRSREFKNTLATMAHELYRHRNFSLYMDRVRVSNRISGTVRNGGDDFTNSASGG
jgi:hypothetical protein